jgi:hypothetical protein
MKSINVSWPRGVRGKSVTKSIAMDCQGDEGIGRGCRRPGVVVGAPYLLA